MKEQEESAQRENDGEPESETMINPGAFHDVMGDATPCGMSNCWLCHVLGCAICKEELVHPNQPHPAKECGHTGKYCTNCVECP